MGSILLLDCKIQLGSLAIYLFAYLLLIDNTNKLVRFCRRHSTFLSSKLLMHTSNRGKSTRLLCEQTDFAFFDICNDLKKNTSEPFWSKKNDSYNGKSTFHILNYLRDSDVSDYESVKLFSRAALLPACGKSWLHTKYCFPSLQHAWKLLKLNHSCHVPKQA